MAQLKFQDWPQLLGLGSDKPHLQTWSYHGPSVLSALAFSSVKWGIDMDLSRVAVRIISDNI